MRASTHLSKQKRRSMNMIFSVTYCEILAEKATSVEVHLPSFSFIEESFHYFLPIFLKNDKLKIFNRRI